MTDTKRNDWLMIGSILVVALFLCIFFRFSQKKELENAMVVVTVDGAVYGRYPLNEEKEEKIVFLDGTYNVLQIKNGEVAVTEASCPDQYCVKHRKISKNMESIICLPNKVVITIEAADEAEVDLSY